MLESRRITEAIFMSNRHRSARRLFIGANLLGIVSCGLALAQPGTIVTFDVPGAGSGFRQGTTATGINPAGEITGYYVDASNIYHGFVRSPGGDYTVFDCFGTGMGTLPYGINDSGAVTGYCFDSYGLAHGFVRSPTGAVTTFVAPPSSATSDTYAFGINSAGLVTGFFFK